MELVIKIPDKAYKDAISGEFCIPVFYEAVKNGTPLQKGHYIDKGLMWECSECGALTRIMKKYKTPNYCPCCGADMRADKDCSTCVNSDETDGSNCYECIKGIKDNYEADKEREE